VSLLFRRIAIARRAVRELVAIAEQRAAAADSKCAATSFRPLTDSETEALVGADLLATLAESVGELKS
jgi:hypothetical protein